MGYIFIEVVKIYILISSFFRFKEQIHDVFKMLPAQVQVILLSATMPDDVMEVSKCFMRDPISILVKKDEVMTFPNSSLSQ